MLWINLSWLIFCLFSPFGDRDTHGILQGLDEHNRDLCRALLNRCIKRNRKFCPIPLVLPYDHQDLVSSPIPLLCMQAMVQGFRQEDMSATNKVELFIHSYIYNPLMLFIDTYLVCEENTIFIPILFSRINPRVANKMD